MEAMLTVARTAASSHESQRFSGLLEAGAARRQSIVEPHLVG